MSKELMRKIKPSIFFSPAIEDELVLLDSDALNKEEIVAQWDKNFKDDRDDCSFLSLTIGLAGSSVLQLIYLMINETANIPAALDFWDLAGTLALHGGIGAMSGAIAFFAAFLVKSSKSSKVQSLNDAILDFCEKNPHLVSETMGAYSIFLESDKNILGKNSSYNNFISSGYADEMRVAFRNSLKPKKEIQSTHAGREVRTKEGRDEGVDENNASILVFKSIQDEWLDVQSDIVKVLSCPALTDMREPFVQEFYVQLQYVQSIGQSSVDFRLAVANLKMKWVKLKSESKRISLSKFNKGERKKVLLARDLMNIALNEMSSVFERKQAYERAMKILDGIIVIQDTAIKSIEKTIGLQEITN